MANGMGIIQGYMRAEISIFIHSSWSKGMEY